MMEVEKIKTCQFDLALYTMRNCVLSRRVIRTFPLGESFWLPLAKKPPPLAPPPVA